MSEEGAGPSVPRTPAPKGSTDGVGLWIAIVVMTLVAVAAIFALPSEFLAPSSIGQAVWKGLLVTAFIVAYAALLFSRFWTLAALGEFLQGMAGLVTIAALLIAAGIYFVERNDRPRLAFSLDADAAPISASGRRSDTLMLSIRIPVTNTGSQRLTIPCIALGIAGLPSGQAPTRSEEFREDLELEPIHEEIEFPSDQSADCIAREARRRGRPAAEIRPAYMWNPLDLEPGETRNLYFETLISCRFSLVRVLVKFRLDPRSDVSSETKTMVPLTSVCRPNAEPRVGVTAPRVEAGTTGAPTSAAPPSAAKEAVAPAE